MKISRNVIGAFLCMLMAVWPHQIFCSNIISHNVEFSNLATGTRNENPTRHSKKLRRVATSVPQKTDEDVSVLSTEDMNANSVLSKFHDTNFVAECLMPSIFGQFKMRSYTYASNTQSLEPIAMIYGDITKENVIVRVHDQCFTGEVFGSMRCDCRQQLHESLKLIKQHGGVLIYLQQEGRGIGISNKIAAYSLQDEGLDTVDANIHLGFKDELREYNAVPDILADLNINSIQLVTNNPFKIEQLSRLGVRITNRISLEIPSNKYNIGYLRSKRDRMRHLISGNLPTEAVSDDVSNDDSHSDSYSNIFIGGSPNDIETAASHIDHAMHAVSNNVVNKGYAFGKSSVEAAISAIREGKVIIVVDDEDRENEGDLIMAAELATPEAIGFIVRYSSGVICVSLESDRLDQLKLPPMVINNEDPKQTAYTVSVDCKHNTTTGISAFDRATTFRALADPNSIPDDFQRPGHVFPLRYKPGGVLARAGHTEASLDFSRLAGLRPAGVLAEVVNDDGSMTRLPGLKKMAQEHGLVLTSVQDLIAYVSELQAQHTR